MNDKIKNVEEKEEEREIPSVIITNLVTTIYQMYKYLEDLEVRGFKNTKILANTFGSLLQITGVLEALGEDVMNLEGKEVGGE